MDPLKVAQLMSELGISGFDPARMSAVMTLMEELGADTQVSREEAQAYLPEPSNLDFYIPRVPKGFYTGCFENLRRLTTPRRW